MKNKVSILRNEFGIVHAIVTRNIFRSTKVFTFHCLSDTPSYFGVPAIDVFLKHDMAVNAIKENFGSTVIGEYIALVGATKENDTLILCLIKEISQCAEMPGHIKVNLIKSVEYISFKQNSYEFGSKFSEFPLEEFHYFSDSLDLTRPFPSFKKVSEPDAEFCWNERWRKPFVIIKEAEACVSILQGFAGSFVHRQHSINFIVRRSALNPGVRYIARGLNDKNEPGNECECELIYSAPDGRLWTHVFRRGSVPIRWQTNNKIITVEHIVTDKTINGAKMYFNKLKKRLFGGETFCICLLNANSSNEGELYHAFENTIHKMNNDRIARFYPFDLNTRLEEEGIAGAADTILLALSRLAFVADFSYCPSAFNENGFLKKDLVFETRQKSTLRINCADSLDRTNICSFFLAVTLTSEFCRRSGLTNSDTQPFMQNKPIDDINPEVMEFLSDSFIKAGDIISALYTNTPAVKTNVIRQYSKAVETTKSDASIAIQRRISNTFSDPQRQVLFENWTNVHFIEPNFFIDHTKIVPLTVGFENDIISFSGNPSASTLTNTKAFVFLLPRCVRITGVYLHVVPMSFDEVTDSITIQGNFNNEFIDIAKEIRIPVVSKQTTIKVPINGFFCRLIKVIINNQSRKVTFGQIGFEGSFEGEKMVYIDSDIKNVKSIDSFMYCLIETYKDPINFMSIQNLEKQRVDHRISMKQFYECCFVNEINPSLFTPRVKEGVCPFCEKPTFDGWFGYSAVLPRRLTIPTDLLKNINVCNECAMNASMISSTTIYLVNNLQPAEESEERTMIDFDNFDLIIPQDLTLNNDAFAFDGTPNGLLDGTEHLTVVKSTLISVVLSFPAEISYIEFVADKFPEGLNVLIMEENGTFEATMPFDKDSKIWIGILKPVLTRKIVISVFSSEPFTINQMTVIGTPKNYVLPLTMESTKVKALSAFNKKGFMTLALNESDLTNVYETTRKLNKMILKVKSKGYNDTLIFCVFYKDHKLSGYKRIDVGYTSVDQSFFYKIIPPTFNRMVVFHIMCNNPAYMAEISITEDV